MRIFKWAALLLFLPSFSVAGWYGGGLRDHGHTGSGDGGRLSNLSLSGSLSVSSGTATLSTMTATNGTISTFTVTNSINTPPNAVFVSTGSNGTANTDPGLAGVSTVTITTNGGGVLVLASAYASSIANVAATCTLEVAVMRGGSILGGTYRKVKSNPTAASGSSATANAGATTFFYDRPAAGSYVYVLRYNATGCIVSDQSLVAIELQR